VTSVGTSTPVVMPARRARSPRVQLNTRVRIEVEQLLQRFATHYETTVQSCVDLALEEFLATRGYLLDSREEQQ
jgi:hypothetical protein